MSENKYKVIYIIIVSVSHWKQACDQYHFQSRNVVTSFLSETSP